MAIDWEKKPGPPPLLEKARGESRFQLSNRLLLFARLFLLLLLGLAAGCRLGCGRRLWSRLRRRCYPLRRRLGPGLLP